MDIIIILGSSNDEFGVISDIGQSRLLAGKKLLEKIPEAKILLTGGFGEHFNITEIAHHEHARKFLEAFDIRSRHFLKEGAESFNTIEDAELSLEIVRQYPTDTVYVVTSNFHMERAKLIFNRVYQEYELRFIVASDEMIPEDNLKKLIAHEKQQIKLFGGK